MAPEAITERDGYVHVIQAQIARCQSGDALVNMLERAAVAYDLIEQALETRFPEHHAAMFPIVVDETEGDTQPRKTSSPR